jgi:hypothetical protein
MNDKIWLEKVSHASSVYLEQIKTADKKQVVNFIEWLYKQYGIAQIKK